MLASNDGYDSHNWIMLVMELMFIYGFPSDDILSLPPQQKKMEEPLEEVCICTRPLAGEAQGQGIPEIHLKFLNLNCIVSKLHPLW